MVSWETALLVLKDKPFADQTDAVRVVEPGLKALVAVEDS